MELTLIIISLVVGIIIGFAGAFFLRIIHTKTARDMADELFRESETLRKEDREAVIENVKASFGDLSLDALNKVTDHVIKLTEGKFKTERELHTKELDTKKGLIDLSTSSSYG